MIQRIDYVFPGDAGSKQAFAALQRMLLGSNATADNGRLVISTAGLNPVTAFRLDVTSQTARVVFAGDQLQQPLPDSFFAQKKLNTFGISFYGLTQKLYGLLARSKSKIPGMSFAEVANKLTGRIIALDATNVAVRPESIIPREWTAAANQLCGGATVYNYPAGPKFPEYDENKARWLFAIPAAVGEDLSKATSLQLRQPKFALICDPKAPKGTTLVIDVVTKLPFEEIDKMFPNSEKPEGLEDFLRRITVPSPFPGFSNVRFHVRSKNAAAPNEWNTARFFLDAGERVRPGGSPTTFPGLTA